MALYDGFFDAEYNAETDQYDREYESGDFTGYLAQVIGSGVCVYNNENSFKVRMGDGAAIISPGYLFIQGYYLKNDADHSLTLPGTGTYAIAAHLSMGKRMIELEAVSVSSSYPDSLVLAIVNGTSNTADDTRYNTDICGVIDSAGELSKRIEYAINYIDNEIEGKLASVQAEIDAQAAKMDAKIAEAQAIVNRIVPPPIGTIKFTAAQNVGEEWIRCDGSFISETDYPDLVEALGKLTPGVESFEELLKEYTQGEQMSNICMYNGSAWVYLVKSKKLIGVSQGDSAWTSTSIILAGTQEFSSGTDVVLSLFDGGMYLAQNNSGGSNFILYESTSFYGYETELVMSALDTSSIVDNYSRYKEFSPYIVPAVVAIGDYVCMAYNLWRYASDNGGCIFYLKWKKGEFESTATTVECMYTIRSQNSIANQFDILPLCAFNPKNGNDMIIAHNSGQNGANKSYLYSVSQGIYGSYSNAHQSADANGIKFDKHTIPVGANGECLLNVSIVSRHPVIHFTNYNVVSPIVAKTVNEVSLPARAKLFKDSVVYAATQSMWFVFVGTGLLFAESLTDGSWGYLDTQGAIGYIGDCGCLNYDPSKNVLYISGLDSAGTPKVVGLKLPDLYNYANDGAFLPNIASDGVPAYIKATEAEGPEPGGDYLVITVQQPVDYGGVTFTNVAQVLFNGSPMIPGTYRRALSDLGSTFTVGVGRTSGFGERYKAAVAVNGTNVATVLGVNTGASTAEVTLTTADYSSAGITLQGRIISYL